MKKNVKFITVAMLVLSMLLTLSGYTGSKANAADPYTAYVMGYFAESPNGSENRFALHLAYSRDGLDWTPLNQNQPVATPTLGYKGLRDPFILRKQDGTFVVMATNMVGQDMGANVSKYIHVWDSTDLINFTGYRLLQVNNSSTMHAWAPEAFWDPSRNQYAILWAGNTDRNRIYVSYTTDFRTVTDYNNLTVYHDPGYDIYDGNMLQYNGMNYFYNANGVIRGFKGSSLNPMSFTNNYVPSLAPSNTAIEAPTLVQKNNENRFYLYGDSYYPKNPVLYIWQTTDISTNSWQQVNMRDYNGPTNAKHVTVVKVTDAELSRLITHWGNPSWNRIKSYNYPTNFWRHQNFAGMISEAPIDPLSDMKWKMVPGLADANGVSFESVNFPGRYLRHSNFSLVVNANDNSQVFKADATFYKTPGFADASWTSFRSYNFPDRYIRHAGGLLRIDPVSTTSSSLDKQDATFKIVY
jgi:hypothetical protein